MTGPDAARLIQRRFTNDLAGVPAGAVRYGAFVNADGLMVDDGNVYKHADEKFWVMINTAGLEDWFRETAGDLDASIAGRTEELPMISATGPGSRDLVQGLTDFDLSSLKYFRFNPEPVQVAGVPTTVLRTGFSGELGFELVTDPGSAVTLWEALVAAGGRPFGLEAIDLARVEAGLIIVAVDYQPGETSPWDVSLDRFIKMGTENVGSGVLASYGATPAQAVQDASDRGRDGARRRARRSQGRRSRSACSRHRLCRRGWAPSVWPSWTPASPPTARRSRWAAPRPRSRP